MCGSWEVGRVNPGQSAPGTRAWDEWSSVANAFVGDAVSGSAPTRVYQEDPGPAQDVLEMHLHARFRS